jgi:hypothetical protein
LGAGVIHFSAAPDHASLPLPAGFFVVAGVAQVLWAALVLRRASGPVLSLGAAGNLALVGVWLASRTTGIGFVPGAETVEPVGFKDAVAVFLELSVVAGVGLLAVLPQEGRELLLSRGRAAVGATVAAVALMTGAGVGLAPSHDHTAGELAGGHAHGGGVQGHDHGDQLPAGLGHHAQEVEGDHVHAGADVLAFGPGGVAHAHEDGDQLPAGLARHAHEAEGDHAHAGADVLAFGPGGAAHAHEHASGPTDADEGHHHGADSGQGAEGPAHDHGHDHHDHDGGGSLHALVTFIEETAKMLGLRLP